MTGKEMSWVIGCYFLGCFTAGYYWVRWRTGKDIRLEGSGTVGARNAGRVLGPSGFLVTLLLDFCKGALAVQAGRLLGMDREVLTMALLAVVIGHNWPFQLRFQGGKGLAVSLGALLTYDYFVLVVLVTLFLPLWAVTRSLTLSAMFAYSIAPLMVFLCSLGPLETFAVSVTSMLVVFAHRKNIREELGRIISDRPRKEPARHRPEQGSS